MNSDNRLLIFRKSLNLSQVQLAANIGVERSALSKYENDGNIPEPILIILELKFNLNRQWLFEGEGEMFTSKSSKGYAENDFKTETNEPSTVKYSLKSIDSLILHNGKLVEQVGELIRMQEKMIEMQLLNVQTINNLSVQKPSTQMLD